MVPDLMLLSLRSHEADHATIFPFQQTVRIAREREREREAARERERDRNVLAEDVSANQPALVVN